MKNTSTSEETSPGLSRREREVMDAVYSVEAGTVTEIMAAMEAPPSRAAVRTFLRILEEKGHLSHTSAGREFVYRPTRPRARAGRSALPRVMDVFFDGSVEKALAAHLMDPDAKWDREALDRLDRLIDEIRKKGK